MEEDRWDADDPTERSDRQRRSDEIRAQSENAAHTYEKMKAVWAEIQRRLARPWRTE